MGQQHRASLNRYARLAGFLFLFYIAAALFSGYVTSVYVVKNDVVATAANIGQGEFAYRVALLLQFASNLTAIVLGWALYVLLRPIDRNWALLALLCRFGEGTVGAVGSVFDWLVLKLYTESGIQGAGSTGLIRLATEASGATFPITVTFFSLGSVIFFALLARTRFIPKWLSMTGVVGSLCATVLAVTLLLLPTAPAMLQLLWLPLLVAEVGTGFLWLARGVGSADIPEQV